MTYAELLDHLRTLTKQQLAQPARVRDPYDRKFMVDIGPIRAAQRVANADAARDLQKLDVEPGNVLLHSDNT